MLDSEAPRHSVSPNLRTKPRAQFEFRESRRKGLKSKRSHYGNQRLIAQAGKSGLYFPVLGSPRGSVFF